MSLTVHGQESRRAVDKMSKPNKSRMDTSVCTRWSGSQQLASDEALSTEQRCKPTRSVYHLREMCSSPALCAQTGCSDDIRLNTVIGITAGGSRRRMSLLRDNDLRSRWTEASEEEGSTTNDDTVQHRVQFRTSIVDDGRGLTVVNKLLGRLARKL